MHIQFRSYIKQLIFILASLFVAFLIGEIALRLIGYHYIPLKLRMLGKEAEISGLRGDWRQYHSQEDDFFVSDPYLIWRPKKNHSPFNSQGFRGPEISNTIKNEYRIFALGDSNTIGLHYNPGWVEYLGELIKKIHPNIRVINAGAWGYTSFQFLRRFKEILMYKPDLVLISCSFNDASRVIISDKDYIAIRELFSTLFWHIRTYQLFLEAYDKIIMKTRKNFLTPRVSPAEYSLYLNEMVGLAYNNNCKIILLTRPFYDFDQPNNEYLCSNFVPLYNEITMKAATKKGVLLVIDIYSLFRDRKDYFSDWAHFNDAGHRHAAEIIYSALQSTITFPNEDHPGRP